MRVDFVDIADRVDSRAAAVAEWCRSAVMRFVSLRSVSAIAKAVKYGVVLPLRRGGAR